jgi:hypothetical protein
MGVVPCSVLNETPLGPLLAELIGTTPNGTC